MMNIILNPKLKTFIQQQISSGKYDSINSIIEEALNLLEKRNQYDDPVEDMRPKIDLAAPQLERIDGETDINQATDNSLWDSEDWEQFDQLIENCLVDTGIEDLAHQHDHYIHGTPKR